MLIEVLLHACPSMPHAVLQKILKHFKEKCCPTKSKHCSGAQCLLHAHPVVPTKVTRQAQTASMVDSAVFTADGGALRVVLQPPAQALAGQVPHMQSSGALSPPCSRMQGFGGS